jgi:cytochrome oxidase Cu insertion factor (SCO1/SenC/PrrC family)
VSSPLGMTEGESLPPHAHTGGRDAAKEPLTPADRTSALAQGAPAIPPTFVFWILGVVLALSVGGLVGEHVFSFVGLNPTPTSTPTTAARAAPPATPGAPAAATDHSLNAPLAAFMGLSAPSPRAAPPFTLTDQAGLRWSVPAQPPRVVVLTFFDAPCNDICPVLASEIERADADLGPLAARVEFLTVNTDPTALAQSTEGPVLEGTGLGALANWRMLTGPLASLDAVWKAYGVSISADTKTGLEAHNDVMDFIDAKGQLRYRATPFADENATGTFSLSPAAIARWGRGMATYAERLVGP